MILTEDRIREAAKFAKNTRIDESMLTFSENKNYDLFISHSFKDKDLVIGLHQLFVETGYNVYIDWIEDANLNRTNVDEKTASIIKNRVKSCKALAYVSTANTPTSKWCPWELGLGDGMLGKVCILPVMKDKFKGQEYLGLYPYLDYESPKGKTEKDFWVNDQKVSNKYTQLRQWLSGKQLTVFE